jgi:hypothetical protein
VLRAPEAGKGFKLYLSTQEKVIGAALTQEDGRKEFAAAYVSRRLLDAERPGIVSSKSCAYLCIMRVLNLDLISCQVHAL